jgi:hypothetical protein
MVDLALSWLHLNDIPSIWWTQTQIWQDQLQILTSDISRSSIVLDCYGTSNEWC